jgi:hypothetical protein
MTPEPSWEEDFNDWYDHEHIPLRMVVPGFLSAQRYRAPDSRHYLAVYEMASTDVLKSAAYQAIRHAPGERTRRMLGRVQGFTRYLAAPIAEHTGPSAAGDPLDAPFVYAVFFGVPVDREAEFNDWYGRDHTPLLLECADWLGVRRFRIEDGEPAGWTHLTLHYLSHLRALESPARARARASPWRARLEQEGWFKGAYHVFQKHGPRQLARPGS